MVDPYDELNDVPNDPDDDWREEWMQIAEEEQIAEGNITVSDTVDGHDPTPDLDDDVETALEDELDDDLAILDGLNPSDDELADNLVDEAFDDEDV